MLKTWLNIFWLGTKELRSIMSDKGMVILIIYSFTLAIYGQATATSETVNNASIAIVDEDHSALSGIIANALYPPYFNVPELISADQVNAAMDQSQFMFVVEIPPNFERDIREGRQPKVQINVDATAVSQASLGNSYIQSIVTKEVNLFVNRTDNSAQSSVELVKRFAFNPNATGMWFGAINALINQISIITIILTGSALLREREHGTIEHLMVMPLTAFQIVMAKVWANGLVILIAYGVSLYFIVGWALDVPLAGSSLLLLIGTSLYLFAAAAIGIFLGTIASTMAQFGLLVMMVIIPLMTLSGGMSPIESQPQLIQPVTWFLPSRHFVSFSQAVVFRGADFSIIWPQLVTMVGLGGLFFGGSLLLFRRSLATSS
ncbi:ABC transporter permease [uncultured Paraglaciecola sp.]|uniref:ABC transporter permease n=1 Tax=uncultured Paraglaciecola sp. TaxID=1765024 RepID=UPI0025992B22|nr:ABC transporter permease [uncultured Paraglaciecola sp.]